MHSLVDADVEHGERLACRADQERPFATELLSEGHQTDGGNDDLDNTVHTGGEKASRATSETDLLEDLGGVVVDGVRAGPLLPEHKDDSKRRAVEDLLARTSRLELGNHRHLFVAIEVSNDVVELLHDLRVVGGLATDVSKRLGGLSDTVLLNEPAGALVHENDTSEENNAREHLQSEGNAPLGRVIAAGDVEVDSVVDEERQTDTSNVEELHAANATSSDFLWCVLRDVCRYNS